MTAVVEPLWRRAVAQLRGTAALLHPDGTRFYRSLLVVDVDLDSKKVTGQVLATPCAQEPEGVHAVIWRNGLVVGQMTLPGRPAHVLPDVVPHAVRHIDRTGAPELRVCSAGGQPGRERDHGLRAEQVTVAVCSRDRSGLLRDCLAALTRMTAPVAEILLVDNASRDDRTRRVVEQFPSVRYVWEPRQGLNWARNRALAEARTPVVAFTDDDVLVHPGWVDGLLRGFREEPRAVVVTGLVLAAELATPAQVLFEGRGGFGRGLDRRRFGGGTGDVLRPALEVVTGVAGAGANMAVRRARVSELGGFDLALDVGTPAGGGGDLEMLHRVVAAGDVVVYEPSAVVRHRHRPTMADLTRQRRGDGTGTYSIFLGAGLRRGSVERAAFLRLAAWWVLKRHLRRAVCSIFWPELWPLPMVLAEMRGMLDATVGRYYERGRAQARYQWLAHPDEPWVPGMGTLAGEDWNRRRSFAFRGARGLVTPD